MEKGYTEALPENMKKNLKRKYENNKFFHVFFHIYFRFLDFCVFWLLRGVGHLQELGEDSQSSAAERHL